MKNEKDDKRKTDNQRDLYCGGEYPAYHTGDRNDCGAAYDGGAERYPTALCG